MSDRGVFAVDRGVFDHPMFAREPYSEREAWIWMVGAAAWKASRVRVGKAMIDLDRGQLAYATRFLATKWQWSHTRVVRFLKRLEIDTMVSTEATRYATRITICNYDKYAFGRNASDTQTETQPDTEVKRSRYKEEELKKDKKEETIKDTRATALVDDDWPTDFRERFWSAYPRKVGKAAALRKLEAVRKAGQVTFATLMAGVERYATACLQIERKYQKHPTTWLNAGCWDDEQLENAHVEKNARSGISSALDNLIEFAERAESAANGDFGSPEGGQASARLLSYR
jgi:hypothetical protein